MLWVGVNFNECDPIFLIWSQLQPLSYIMKSKTYGYVNTMMWFHAVSYTLKGLLVCALFETNSCLIEDWSSFCLYVLKSMFICSQDDVKFITMDTIIKIYFR